MIRLYAIVALQTREEQRNWPRNSARALEHKAATRTVGDEHTLLLVAMRNTEKQPGQLSTLIAEQFSRNRCQYS